MRGKCGGRFSRRGGGIEKNKHGELVVPATASVSRSIRGQYAGIWYQTCPIAGTEPDDPDVRRAFDSYESWKHFGDRLEDSQDRQAVLIVDSVLHHLREIELDRQKAQNGKGIPI